MRRRTIASDVMGKAALLWTDAEGREHLERERERGRFWKGILRSIT